MIFTGDMIEAQEVHRMGLISYIAPMGELIPKAEEITGQIIKNVAIPVKLGIEELSIRESIYH